MPAPFRYRDSAEIIGSWPFAPTPDLAPTQVPHSIDSQATILGFQREPFGVGAMTFSLTIDGGSNNVTFGGLPGASRTIAQVVADINAVSPGVAFNDNGFLRIRSTTSGVGSSVRIDAVSGQDVVLEELGFISGYEALGGEIQQAQHIDPSRQISWAGQLGLSVGESYAASSINRIAHQLGMNADQARGAVDLKRLARRREETFVVGDLVVAGGRVGVQLNAAPVIPGERVYLGPHPAPSIEQLKEAVVVLDTAGNEYTTRMEDAGADQPLVTFAFNSLTKEQHVSCATIVFQSTDPDSPIFVVPTTLTGGAAALNDNPLKITRYISASEVVIDSIDPATGTKYEVNQVNRTARRSGFYAAKCEVDGFYEADLSTSIDPQSTFPLGSASGAVTKISRNNVVTVDQPGVNFFLNVKPGDLVFWDAAASSDPWTNNGYYRVEAVLSDKSLSLVGEDYGPVYLNPNMGASYGSIEVQNDGDFSQEPYVRFVEATLANFQNGIGAIPQGDFKVVYKVQSNFRECVTEDQGILGSHLKGELEATSEVQAAIMRIVGPSITRFDELLYGKTLLNLEGLTKEHHYAFGRHSDIHPDTIETYPEITGVQTRFLTSENIGVVREHKVELYDYFTNKVKWAINNFGGMGMGRNGVDFTPRTNLGLGGSPIQLEFILSQGLSTGAAQALFESRYGGHIILSGSAETGFGGFQTNKQGVSSTRYYWNNTALGGSEESDFSIVHHAKNIAGEALLALGNVNDDGGGSAYLNNLIVYSNGNIGIHFDDDILVGSPPLIPTVPLHIVDGRDYSELIRLEGGPTPANDPQVGITFKPRRDSSRPFGAIDIEHDGTPGNPGDWLYNFALDQEAEDDSDGAVGEAYFRWVAKYDPTGPTFEEWMRLTSAGLEFTKNLCGISFRGQGAAVTFYEDQQEFNMIPDPGDEAYFTLNERVIAEFDSLNSVGGRVVGFGSLVASNTSRLLHDPVTVSGPGTWTDHYLSEIIETLQGGAGAERWGIWAHEHAFRLIKGMTHSGDGDPAALSFTAPVANAVHQPGLLEIGPNLLRSYRYDGAAAPFSVNTGLELGLEFIAPNRHTGAPDAEKAAHELRINNGIVELFDPYAHATGSNIPCTTAPRPNTIYAMNVLKAWVNIRGWDISAGTTWIPADKDGFNVEKVVYDNVTQRIQVFFKTPMEFIAHPASQSYYASLDVQYMAPFFGSHGKAWARDKFYDYVSFDVLGWDSAGPAYSPPPNWLGMTQFDADFLCIGRQL